MDPKLMQPPDAGGATSSQDASTSGAACEVPLSAGFIGPASTSGAACDVPLPAGFIGPASDIAFPTKKVSPAEKDAMFQEGGIHFRNKNFQDKYWELVVGANQPSSGPNVACFRFKVPLWNPTGQICQLYGADPVTKRVEIFAQDGFDLVVQMNRSCLFAHDVMWADMGDVDLKPLPVVLSHQTEYIAQCALTVATLQWWMQMVAQSSCLRTQFTVCRRVIVTQCNASALSDDEKVHPP